MTQQLPDEKVLERIQKLLNLAADKSNEHESANANAAAQQLLSQYNLDLATVEKAGDAKAGKREEAKVDGGFYQHSRELWREVAKLNFCLYWTQEYSEFTKSKRVGTGRHRYTTLGRAPGGGGRGQGHHGRGDKEHEEWNMRLFVIMANDFPEGVMNDEKAAEQLVKSRNDAEQVRTSKSGYLSVQGGGSRIYWRAHPFSLNDEIKELRR